MPLVLATCRAAPIRAERDVSLHESGFVHPSRRTPLLVHAADGMQVYWADGPVDRQVGDAAMREFGEMRVFSDHSRETFGHMEAEPRIDPAASACVCPQSRESRTSGPTVTTMHGPTRAPSLARGEERDGAECQREPRFVVVAVLADGDAPLCPMPAITAHAAPCVDPERAGSDHAHAMGSFKAAVIQAAAAGFDLDRGLDKVARLAGEARAGGGELAVFPEAFLPAYPRGIAFGTVLGDRTAEGRDQFRRYFDASVDVPGPAVDRLAAIAAENFAARGDRRG